MRLFLLVCLTMIAFAANSVLNRLALADGAVGPASFALVRLAAGVVMLFVLMSVKGGWPHSWRPNLFAVTGLAAYMLGFSFAYLSLAAGLGALVLFGGVQITMFLGAIALGQHPGRLQWLGSAIAFSGLVYLLLPGAGAPDPVGFFLMLFAAAGWGLYSIIGQKVTAPLTATSLNFLFAMPIALLAWVITPTEPIAPRGLILACLSGGVTSAMGYALWYQLLPRLNIATAAVAQLTVPLIAMGGGMVFLAEPLGLRFLVAAVLVLGGVGVSLLTKAFRDKSESN
ncbi:MAG: DMT family transporter [Rhodobacteraceae bacterium]|nr:DMT family transporter [Paracoccaceae bacterium]